MISTRALRSAAAGILIVILALAGCGGDGTEPSGGSGSGPGAGADRPSGEADPGVGQGDGSLDDVSVQLTEVAQLDRPTVLAARPDSTTLYVGERAGTVRALEEGDDGSVTVADEPVLDLSGEVSLRGEQGLLGLTFSADGDVLYVSYTNQAGDSRVVAYEVDGDEVVADSRRELLAVDQPYANHNGGDIKVGPDGYLYVGLGDGGAADDPENRAQDPDDLLGKILRIDPSAGDPYAIPEGNPYAGGGGAPEIFLSGVRNPWRFSFDDGDLWIGDVGQNEIEEVDRVPLDEAAGANLGWSGYEGSEVFIEDRVQDGTVPPVYEYRHADGGCSITGGEVYRGERIPDLQGTYVFGDYCDGKVRALNGDQFRELGAEVPSLVSINRDNDGELYLLSLDGPVYRLDA